MGKQKSPASAKMAARKKPAVKLDTTICSPCVPTPPAHLAASAPLKIHLSSPVRWYSPSRGESPWFIPDSSPATITVAPVGLSVGNGGPADVVLVADDAGRAGFRGGGGCADGSGWSRSAGDGGAEAQRGGGSRGGRGSPESGDGDRARCGFQIFGAACDPEGAVRDVPKPRCGGRAAGGLEGDAGPQIHQARRKSPAPGRVRVLGGTGGTSSARQESSAPRDVGAVLSDSRSPRVASSGMQSPEVTWVRSLWDTPPGRLPAVAVTPQRRGAEQKVCMVGDVAVQLVQVPARRKLVLCDTHGAAASPCRPAGGSPPGEPPWLRRAEVQGSTGSEFQRATVSEPPVAPIAGFGFTPLPKESSTRLALPRREVSSRPQTTGPGLKPARVLVWIRRDLFIARRFEAKDCFPARESAFLPPPKNFSFKKDWWGWRGGGAEICAKIFSMALLPAKTSPANSG